MITLFQYIFFWPPPKISAILLCIFSNKYIYLDIYFVFCLEGRGQGPAQGHEAEGGLTPAQGPGPALTQRAQEAALVLIPGHDLDLGKTYKIISLQ